MQGDPRIIDLLNQFLRKELTGINQYFIPTTLLNGISHEGVFSCARDRHGDDAVACPL